jgi:YfiH family protein
MSLAINASHETMLWPMAWKLPAGVHALCSTRLGGVSQPPFDALNLGDHVQDDLQAVTANRAIFQAQLGGASPIFLKQVHGTRVVTLDATSMDGIEADACITQNPHLACTIMVADCLPLLLTDDRGQVVAAAHAGWRGLAQGVIEATVHAVCAVGQVQPSQVLAWLGPCIGPEAFEVGEDVKEALKAPDYFKPHPAHAHKWLADLAGMARVRLGAMGVRSIAGNDSTQAWCTVSQTSKLFSFRRDGSTGRFAASIWRS